MNLNEFILVKKIQTETLSFLLHKNKLDRIALSKTNNVTCHENQFEINLKKVYF